MRFPTLKQAAFVGAVFGAVGPLLYYISQPAREFILGNGLFLWPTGLIIIVTYGHEHDLFGYAASLAHRLDCSSRSDCQTLTVAAAKNKFGIREPRDCPNPILS